MSSNDTPIVRAKKGVALSGIAAGSTALCTVGRSGNDLHYCGYDIYYIAETCEYEEVAYLLIDAIRRCLQERRYFENFTELVLG